MALKIFIFLLLNFAALGLGGLFTSKGVPSEWYAGLNKAPWTPPGWVFGVAWTVIMISFSFYMAHLWTYFENKKILVFLFLLQLILNVIWNPVFFHFNNVIVGLVVISALTILIGFFMIYFYPILKLKTSLIMPYFIWLVIASSLNAYILIKN